MTEPADAGAPAPLPPREPRSFVTHAAVDAVIAFLATAIVLYFLGAPLWVMILVAWVLGIAAAPFTVGWEARQLAEREADATSDPDA
ncbi:MAG TPA: hypothetical protein VFW06_01925 [Acidimicrobiia bacterium]|nr:hypothetical protein [Acidimicrobiia bacterium]